MTANRTADRQTRDRIAPAIPPASPAASRPAYAAPQLVRVAGLDAMQGGPGNRYDDRVFCRYYG